MILTKETQLQSSYLLYSQIVDVIIFSKQVMECPKCKSHSVRMEKGARVCGVKGCTFIDVHPISYDNDVMHYEGQDKKENRFSTIYSPCLAAGGIELEKEANFDKNYKKGRKHIADWCFLMGLNENTINIATARFLTILKIINQDRQAREKEMENQEGEQSQGDNRIRRERHKNILSIKNMAAYAIYSACFEKENYFEDFYLSKALGVNAKYWKQLVKEMNLRLKNRIDFVPILRPKHLIIRVCSSRKMNKQGKNEIRAMIQMCQNIQNVVQSDIRTNTIAALAFWKVCENSSIYSGKFSLSDFCKPHQKLEEEGAKISQIQKYFDVTPQNVRKVFKDSIKPYFNNKLFPAFQGRLPIKDSNKNEQQ